MPLIAFALIGVAVGAAGAELLHFQQPEMVKKIQASAKIFVNRFVSCKSADKESSES